MFFTVTELLDLSSTGGYIMDIFARLTENPDTEIQIKSKFYSKHNQTW